MPGIVVHGTGSIGMRHLRVLRQLNIPVKALSVRPDRLTFLEAEGFDPATDFAGARGVIIATETGRHIDDAIAALRSGSSVLVEKPIATDATEIASLRTAIQETGKQVFVGCVLRFSASLQRFKEWLPRVGRVHDVRIECQSYLPDWRPQTDYRQMYCARANEGGVLRDLVHELDYAVWLFGRPSALTASLVNTGTLQIQAEESADLLWQSGTATVSLRLDYLTRTSRRRMTAFGDAGELAWDGVGQTVTLTSVDGSEHQVVLPQERDEMFSAQAKAFLEALAEKNSEPLCTLSEADFVMRLCDAARLSSSEGRTVRLGPDEQL